MMYCKYTDDECVYGEERNDIDVSCEECIWSETEDAEVNNVDTCIVCGAPIPEGRQICPLCEPMVHE